MSRPPTAPWPGSPAAQSPCACAPAPGGPAAPPPSGLARLAGLLRGGGSVRLLALGLAAGAMAGLAAAAYFAAVELAQFVLLRKLAGLDLPAPAGESLFHGTPGLARPWLIPVFTTLTGLFTGWLIGRFAPDAADTGTDGTDAVIRAFHRAEGGLAPRAFLIRSLTSILTIGSGGSAGREGPMGLLGGGLASWLARILGLTARERRILLLAGVAGGIGAIFRAPLGGALTAIEVVYKEDFESEAVLPAIISSVTAYSVFTLFFGTQPIFAAPDFRFSDPRELLFYAALSLVCTAVGWAYCSAFRAVKYRLFRPLAQRAELAASMGLGGLGMGLLGWAFPETLAGGYGWLETAIRGETPLVMLAGMLLGKTLATSLTIGSGMSGGMFAPALFTGGMAGGMVGQAAHALFPDLAREPGAYTLVGMAAFFAGVANAPVGCLVMVCELTRGYGLLAPLMFSSVLCIALGRRFSLYENQVAARTDSPAHAGEAAAALLESMRVGDHCLSGRIKILPDSATLGELTGIIAETSELCFPVANAQGTITGVLQVQDLRRVLFEDALFNLLLVHDVAGKLVSLSPEDNLHTALLAFVSSGLPQIPVMDPDRPDRVLGMLDREHVFTAYARAVEQAGV